jgi:CheY-like chemotaxis protein
LCQAWEARKSSRVNWTFWSALDLAPQGPAQTRQDEPDLDGFGQGESDRGRPCSGGVERKLLMLNGSVTDTGKPKSKSKFGAVASPTRAQKRHLRHARRLGRMPFAASSYLNTAKLRASGLQKPDLSLTDLIMPKFSGFELCRRQHASDMDKVALN